MNKLIILVLFFTFSHFIFGQASSSSDFLFEVKFDKNIPIRNIEVHYYQVPGNHFKKINYSLDCLNNKIKLFGSIDFIVGAPFPTIIFSYKETIKENESSKINEITSLFYLVSTEETYESNFNKEILFSKEKPNILVEHKNIKGKIIYKIKQFEEYFIPSDFNVSYSNRKIKIIELK
jgi:hypothetical protein